MDEQANGWEDGWLGMDNRMEDQEWRMEGLMDEETAGLKNGWPGMDEEMTTQ